MKLVQLLLVFAALLGSTPLAPGQAPSARRDYTPPTESAPETIAVRRVLDPRHRGGRANEDLLQELVGIGPRCAPVLVAILTGALPWTDWEDSGLTLEEAGTANSGDDHLLREALRRLPPPAVARAIEEACAGEVPFEQRLVGLHLLAEAGQGREAVACWHSIVTGVEEIHLHRAYVRAQLETALANCLTRSAAGFETLRGKVRSWERRLLPSIVHACVQAKRRQGVDVLFDLHAVDRELDLELLATLPGLAAETVGGLDDLRDGWIAGFLADPDADVRSRAALALGKLRDPGNANRLVDALADSEPSVVQSALWALKQLSGVQILSERADWQSWLDDERRWSNEDRPRSIEGLAAQDPARVVTALRELSQHPLYRHASAAAIAEVREREEPEVLCAACVALRELGTMAGFETLTALLDRPEQDVRDAARATLVALTGQDLPPEAEAWQRLLGS